MMSVMPSPKMVPSQTAHLNRGVRCCKASQPPPRRTLALKLMQLYTMHRSVHGTPIAHTARPEVSITMVNSVTPGGMALMPASMDSINVYAVCDGVTQSRHVCNVIPPCPLERTSGRLEGGI